MKTYSAKPTDVVRKWYIIDASDAPLGRIANHAATLLTGKRKPMFTHHIDCGDNVVIINAANLVTTGNKEVAKKYYRHSGYPGGLTELSLKDVMAKDPTAVMLHAVRGMLPVNKLRDERLKRLKIYVDANHKHDPQAPIAISLKSVAKTPVKKEGIK